MILKLRRTRCPYVAACPFRHDPVLHKELIPGGLRLTGSGERRRFFFACPHRRDCPLRLGRGDRLIRFLEDDAVEITAAMR